MSRTRIVPRPTSRAVKRYLAPAALGMSAVVLLAGPVSAQDISEQYDRTVPTGAEAMNMVVLDNIFIFFCAALVFLMQAGFGLVEAGLTRAKNAANIMMKNLMDVSAGILVFGLVGWGIAYPGDFAISGWLGSAGLGVPGLTDTFVDISPEALADDGFYPLSVPVDFFFQAAFAATAATIVSGAVAGRTKFIGYLAYTVVLTALIYPIVVSWQWGGGWLSERGFEDFAGSGLVHMTGGFAALMGALIIGPRIGKFADDGTPKAMPGHSIPLAITGVFLLFIGWFGFNPGSELAADMAVPLIAVYTAFAAAAGAVAAMITAWVTMGKPDVSMAGNGLLAGLVAICSGVGVLSPITTLITGAVAGVIVVLSVLGIERLGIDDPVGAFSVHGACGFWGLLATGLFVSDVSFGTQLIGGVAIAIFVSLFAGALFVGLRSIGMLRVSPEEEMAGLDVAEHGSPGYGPDMLVGSTF